MDLYRKLGCAVLTSAEEHASSVRTLETRAPETPDASQHLVFLALVAP
jgi:hypothetical protein